MIALLLFPAFLSLGAATLLFQVTGARSLALLLGNTYATAAALLSLFMAGLSAGSLAAGRLLQRRGPLPGAPALLALGVALVAGAAPPLYRALGSAAAPVPSLVPVALLPTALVALFLGALLPLALAWLPERPFTCAWALGSQALGAAAGLVLGIFRGLPLLGFERTAWAAALLCLPATLLFAAAGWRARRWRAFHALPLHADEPGPRPLLLVLFVTGFVGLGLEVLGTRLLTYQTEGFTTCFAIALAALLAGNALGALLALLSPRSAPERNVPALLVTAGAVLLLGLHVIRHGPWAPGAWGQGARAAAVLGATALAPPALLLGALGPIAAAAYAGRGGGVPRRLARALAANAAGSVLGPAAGWLLLGAPGPEGACIGLALLLVVLGLGLRQAARAPGGLRLALVALPVVAALAFPLRDAGPGLFLRSPVFRGARADSRRLTRFLEGREGSVAVVDDLATGDRLLYTGEFQAAATGPRYRYMKLLGHLPALLAHSPRRALNLAFGTGTTAGALATHAEVETLDVVELSPEVVAVAGLFHGANLGVLGDPRVRVHLTDGRGFLRRPGPPFDLLTVEPLMPYAPGGVLFYTREFYRAAARRLAPGGILCQWIPLHGVSTADFRSLLQSALAELPDVSLWVYDRSAALLARPAPATVPASDFLRRAAAPRVVEDLRRALYASPAAILSGFVLGDGALRAFAADAAPLTDDRPFLETRPLWRGAVTTFLGDNLLSLAAAREEAGVAGLPQAGTLPPEVRSALDATVPALRGRGREDRALYWSLTGRASEAYAELKGAVQEYRAALTRLPAESGLRRQHNAACYRLLLAEGGRAVQEGRFDLALFRLLQARDLDPEETAARSALVALLRRLGDAARADRFERELGGRPPADALTLRFPPAPPRPDAPLPSLEALGRGTAAERRREVERRAGALAKTPDPSELEALRRGAEDPSAPVGRRADALRVLARLRRADLAPAARAAVLSADLDLARAGVEAAAAVLDEETLLQACGDRRDPVRRLALEVLGEVPLRMTIPALIAALRLPDEEDRLAASVSLHNLTAERFDFDPKGSMSERAEAIRRFERFWRERGPELYWDAAQRGFR